LSCFGRFSRGNMRAPLLENISRNTGAGNYWGNRSIF
jgi:hypothetical protein